MVPSKRTQDIHNGEKRTGDTGGEWKEKADRLVGGDDSGFAN